MFSTFKDNAVSRVVLVESPKNCQIVRMSLIYHFLSELGIPVISATDFMKVSSDLESILRVFFLLCHIICFWSPFRLWFVFSYHHSHSIISIYPVLIHSFLAIHRIVDIFYNCVHIRQNSSLFVGFL